MKVYRLDQFKCPFCSDWFNVTSRLPLKLRCGHSVCRYCLSNQHPINNSSVKIVCPEDLQVSIYRGLSEVEVDLVTKHILYRLLSPADMKKCNNHLESIQQYCRVFDDLHEKVSGRICRVSELLDVVYKEEIQRIYRIWARCKAYLNRPLQIIQDWREAVKAYLRQLKKTTYTNQGKCDFTQFYHYLYEARRIKLEVSAFISLDGDEVAYKIIQDRKLCFYNCFSIVYIKPSSEPDKYNRLDDIRKRARLSQHIEPIKQMVGRYQEYRVSLNSVFDLSRSGSLMEHVAKENKESKYKYNREPLKNIKISRNAEYAVERSEQPLKNIEELHEYYMLLSTHEQEQDNPSDMQWKDYRPKKSVAPTSPTFTYTLPTNELRNLIAKKLTTPGFDLLNFRKHSQVAHQNESPSQQYVRRGYVYDCEQEKHNYLMKMRILRVQYAMVNTVTSTNFIELVSHPLEGVDFRCYLEMQQWPTTLEIVKLVKVGLRDDHLNILLNFLGRQPSVQTMVVSHNQLTDDSVDMLIEFYKEEERGLKNIYLSKNSISLVRCRHKIQQLKQDYRLNIYI